MSLKSFSGEIADAGDNVEENVDIYGTLSDGEIPVSTN